MSNTFSAHGHFTLRTKLQVPTENIIEYFSLDSISCAAIIICPHDGIEVSNLILEHLKIVLRSPSFISLTQYSEIKDYLEKIFLSFDNKYLKNAEQYLKKRNLLNERLSNIEFDSEFESLMKSMEEIERIFKCGCTLSLAILLNNILYVAGIGDNQIIVLMDDDHREDQRFLLLTEEHSFYNDSEIRRIKDTCELSANALSNLCGKSFSKYHSRCLGHYEMKCEYMKFDNFCNSKASPLICLPHISEGHKISSKWRYLIFVSSALYYIVMELIYDRDKIPGEIANEFLMTKEQYPDKSLSEISEIVVRKYFDNHNSAFEENESLNSFECEHEELMLMAIELSVNDYVESTELDYQDSHISSVANDTVSSGIYSSLTKSLTTSLPPNTVIPYVSFDSWYTAEKRLSSKELENIDLLLSLPLDDNVVIIEEDECNSSSKVSRATTLNEVISIEENNTFLVNDSDFLNSVTNDDEPIPSIDVRSNFIN